MPIRAILALACVLLLAVSPAAAQERDPTPKELWDAYPLEPGEAAPTPGTDIPDPTATAPRAAAPAEQSGVSWYLPAAGGLALGLAAFGLLWLRRGRVEPPTVPAAPPRRTAPPRDPAPAQAEQLTIEWRPPPPRPAPPAPPPPVNGSKR